jgi:uncharacterized repeat protein (TIGR04076 family)
LPVLFILADGGKMKRVKITVLKKEFYGDYAEKYITDGKEVGPCSLLKEGEVFIYEGGAEMPNEFCPWAWIDIYRGVNALSAGATYTPWNKQDGVQILCCTDGIRPVIFSLEAIDE